ncbi:hypothetical protein [Burkholderia sp. LMG 13014]|uniref:hypothetical protein n=1 Tax=Burkholderia sp. LMG 13014 TaxID=2709306 RepID=UPI001F063A53|nr:hypothetical protein [Burkholderia sp. LMG 13014]
MSGYAYQWAKRQRVGDSSAKTLLKTYAHWAAEDYSTWVTNDELLLDTELNIQTIRKARAKLIELGFLVETDRRLGETRSIVVYQIVAPAGSTVVQAVDQRSGDTISLSPPTVEEYSKQGEKQSRSKSRPSKGGEISSGSKSQAARNPASSPSKSHAKGGEISSEEGPNLEGKKAVEVQEKNGEQRNARRAPRVALHAELLNLELPEWLPFDAWDAWCEHREAKATGKNGIPWTRPAARVSLKKLEQIHGRGMSVVDAIDESVLRGWTGIWEAKAADVAGAAGGAADGWWVGEVGWRDQGKRLGIDVARFQYFEQFKAKVCKTLGPGPWMEFLLAAVSRESEERGEHLYAYLNDIPRDQVAQPEAA